MVEKMETIEYNVFRKPGMHDNSCNLNLQNFKRDSYYLCNMSGLRTCSGRQKTDADAHLAAARSQNTGTGIWGCTKDERQLRICSCLFSYI